MCCEQVKRSYSDALRFPILWGIGAQSAWTFAGQCNILTTRTCRIHYTDPLSCHRLSSFTVCRCAGMTDTELIELLTTAVNRRVDVPWVPESVEATLIRPVVSGVVEELSDELKGYLADAADGLDSDERLTYQASLLKSLTSRLTAGVPLWIQGWVETQLQGWIEPILQVIFDYTEKGLSVHSAGAIE